MSPQLSAWLKGPFQSYVVSQAYAAWSILVFAVGLALVQGQFHNWVTFFAWLETISFPFFLALVFGIGPFARAKQGANRLANTVTLADGTQAVITKTPAPPAKETP